jgi:hypothetical protein
MPPRDGLVISQGHVRPVAYRRRRICFTSAGHDDINWFQSFERIFLLLRGESKNFRGRPSSLVASFHVFSSQNPMNQKVLGPIQEHSLSSQNQTLSFLDINNHSTMSNHLPNFLRNLLHTPLPSRTQQTRQRNPPRQRQPHIPPHPNRHTRIIMAIQLIMLIRPNARRNMMEHRRRYHRLRIRQRAARLACSSRGHRVREGHEDQRERNQTPAVVAHVVEFEVVGGEVGLRGRAEPADDHDGVVDAAEAAEAVPEGCAVGVGVEDLGVIRCAGLLGCDWSSNMCLRWSLQ